MPRPRKLGLCNPKQIETTDAIRAAIKKKMNEHDLSWVDVKGCLGEVEAQLLMEYMGIDDPEEDEGDGS